MVSWSALFVNLAFLVIGAGLVFGSIWLGYWMGRNSQDKPVRSPHNPGRMPNKVAPIDEPEGDFWEEAMTPAGADDRVATLKEEDGR